VHRVEITGLFVFHVSFRVLLLTPFPVSPKGERLLHSYRFDLPSILAEGWVRGILINEELIRRGTEI
jgi:hypothetical protein